jgi:hypothetical protein
MQMLSPFFMQFCCVGTVSVSNIPSLEEMCSFSQSVFLFEAEKKHIAQSIVSLCWTEGAERLHAQMPNGTGCKKSSAW